MTTPPTPSIPGKSSGELLGPAGQRVLRTLTAEFGAHDAEVRLLCETAAHAWERAEQARDLLVRDGLVVVVGKGCFEHPGMKIERGAQATFLSALRVLRQPSRRSKPGRRPMGELVDANGPSRQSRIAEKYFPTAARRRGTD